MNPIDGPVVTWDDGEEPGWFDAQTHWRIHEQRVHCLKCKDEVTREEVVQEGGLWFCSCGVTQVLA